MRKIKLIWDFKGPNSLGIAKHHCIHLKEFVQNETLNFFEIQYEEINPMWTLSFITINEEDISIFKEALKPHRATLAD